MSSTPCSRHRPHIIPHTLRPEVIADLRETIFHQRPLKPVEVGRCTFVPEEERLASRFALGRGPRHLRDAQPTPVWHGPEAGKKADPDATRCSCSMLLRGENVTFRQLRKTLKHWRRLYAFRSRKVARRISTITGRSRPIWLAQDSWEGWRGLVRRALALDAARRARQDRQPSH